MTMQETLHVHESTDGRGSCDEVEISCDSSDTTKHDTEVEEQKTYEENLLKNWPLMSTIIVYCVFSLQEIAYSEVNSVLICYISLIVLTNTVHIAILILLSDRIYSIVRFARSMVCNTD